MSDPEGELYCDIESNDWIVHLTCFALFVAMLRLLLLLFQIAVSRSQARKCRVRYSGGREAI